MLEALQPVRDQTRFVKDNPPLALALRRTDRVSASLIPPPPYRDRFETAKGISIFKRVKATLRYGT